MHGRSGLRVAAPAERRRDGRGIELRQARADDAEDASVHLDEADEREGVREVDDLVGEVRDAVDVGRPFDRGDQHLDAGDVLRLERRDERVEKRALVLRERRAQELRDYLLAGAVSQAPGEGLGVADAGVRVAE